MGSVIVGIHEVHAAPTAYATPLPAYCVQPNSQCEKHGVYTGAAALGTTSSSAATNGLGITISFSIPTPNPIQSDNELGACISAYAPSHYGEDLITVGRDYLYYGCVNVDSDGSISFVSSAWIDLRVD
jgi:hypothetical protein